MKLFITMFFIAFSFKAFSAPLKVDVYLSTVSCVDSGPSLGSEVWDEEVGMWRKTPTQFFDISKATSHMYLGESSEVRFPRGDSDTLYFGWFPVDYDGYEASVNFDSNSDALTFKNLISTNYSDYVLVYMYDCGSTMVGRRSTGEVSQASYFLREDQELF